MVACIHVGNKKHVAVDLDNQNPLAWVTSLAWMFLHIQEFPSFNGNHNRLEAKPSFGNEMRILLRTPGERLHARSLAIPCASCHQGYPPSRPQGIEGAADPLHHPPVAAFPMATHARAAAGGDQLHSRRLVLAQGLAQLAGSAAEQHLHAITSLDIEY